MALRRRRRRNKVGKFLTNKPSRCSHPSTKSLAQISGRQIPLFLPRSSSSSLPTTHLYRHQPQGYQYYTDHSVVVVFGGSPIEPTPFTASLQKIYWILFDRDGLQASLSGSMTTNLCFGIERTELEGRDNLSIESRRRRRREEEEWFIWDPPLGETTSS